MFVFDGHARRHGDPTEPMRPSAMTRFSARLIVLELAIVIVVCIGVLRGSMVMKVEGPNQEKGGQQTRQHPHGAMVVRLGMRIGGAKRVGKHVQ